MLSQVDKFSEHAGKYDKFINEKDDELGEGTIVVELDKALYGCLQSARRWYETLKEALISMEYECSKRDPCVFRKFNEEGKIVASVFMHVDDGYFSCETQTIYDEFIDKLNKRFPYGVTYSDKESQIRTRGVFEGVVNDAFYHDMESYGTQWLQSLDLPGVPERRYYSQIKVIKREGNHLVVKDITYAFISCQKVIFATWS